jgi:hypothetical protein
VVANECVRVGVAVNLLISLAQRHVTSVLYGNINVGWGAVGPLQVLGDADRVESRTALSTPDGRSDTEAGSSDLKDRDS